ncbi:hypothetical protein [Acinetobacter sp. Marseille-Q1618]|uniref:hypothetical protein n=1 Tax=Acinetobacter sp. Marseille-Q1618 TaxID=2697502 RepID=UPI00156EEA6E|nr:hypothetical protein [Acinetobacter sp. Marseille-Q1618]
MDNNNFIDWGKSTNVPQLYKLNLVALFGIIIGLMLYRSMPYIFFTSLIALPICFIIENVLKMPYAYIFQYIRCLIFGKIKSPRKK